MAGRLNWTGLWNNDWGYPMNWDAGRAPTNGDELDFGFVSDSNRDMWNDIPNLELSAMYFGNNDYQLGGNSLSVSHIDNTEFYNNGSSASETVDINCPLVVVGDCTVTSGGAPGIVTQTTLYTHLNGPITFQDRASLTLWGQSASPSLGIIGGGNGWVYVSGVISGPGDVTALADDDGSGDVSSVEFDGTALNTFAGTLWVSSSGSGQIVFNQSSGFVATNCVAVAAVNSNTKANLNFAATNQLGDYTSLVVTGGLALHLSGNNVTVGSLVLTNSAGDANASTLDTGSIEVGLNYGLTGWNDSLSVTPIIKGKININGVVNCNMGGAAYGSLEMQAKLASLGGLSVNGSSALLLETSNAFTGPVIVNSGTLDLRAQGALGLGSGVQLNGGTLTLNSMDIAGELLSVTAPNSTLDANGPCTWEGSITLDDQLSVYAADSLQLAINGNISGPGGFMFLGQNIGLGGGANTYSGTTYSLCALLQLNGGFSGWINSDQTMSGPLVIGNASGASCEVRWENYARLFNSSSNNQPPVTLYPGALMNLNGFEDIIGSLTFNGGTVELGTNGVLMPGPVLVNPNSAQVSIEGGQLDTGPQLGPVIFPASSLSTIDVESSVINVLTISSTIVGDYGITKVGPGYLPLTGNNSFTGNNWISNGVVEVYSTMGLGSAANATTVQPGGTLALETNVTIEPMLTNNGGVLLDFGNALYLSGGLTNSDFVSVLPGATLTLGTGGTSGSTSNSFIVGAGNLVVEGPANFAGTVNVAGSNIFNLTGFYVANLTGDYTCTNNVLTIGGGTANLNGTGIVAPATLTVNVNGTLGGSDLVTVSGPTTLSTSSTLTGTNLVVANGGLAILGGLQMSGRALVNNGTCDWNGAGAIGLNNGATLSNGPAGTFDCTAGGTIQFGGGQVANAGLFLTTGATATTTIGALFNNYGMVEVQSGVLSLTGGLTNSGGISINSGSTLDVGSAGVNSLSAPGSSVTGAGNIAFSGTGNFAGTVNVGGSNTFNSGTASFTGPYTCTNNAMIINDGTANFNGTGIVAPATLTVNLFGNLGGSNLVSVSGPTVFGNSSALSGSNLVVANGGLTILSGLTISGRTLVNAASGLWTNSLGGVPGLGFSFGGVLSNAPGATLEFAGNDNVGFSTGGGAIVNAGTFLKTGAGSTSTLDAPFTNSATVNIEAGTLALGGGGVSSANISVTSGAGIQFSGGTFTVPPGGSISGAGSFTVSAGTPNFAGTVNLGGSNTISGGTATFTGPYICTNNALTIGGTANFNGTGVIAPATLTVNLFGNLGGSNLVSVSGPTVFGNSSALSGTNLVVANGGLTILSGLSISGRTLVNTGSGLWTNSQGGVPNLGLSLGAVLSNAPGATLEFAGNDNIGFSPGCSVVNAGTLLKTGAGSTSAVGVPFANNGMVSIQNATLAASGGYVSAPNAVLNCVLGGTTAGVSYGQLQVGGSVALNGTLSVNLTSNYVPTINTSFILVSAGSRNGTFSKFIYPSNQVAMVLSNTATSVVAIVTNVFTLPGQPVLHLDRLSATSGLLYWSTNFPNYFLEYNLSLGTTNWAASGLTPVIAGTNFVVTNSLSSAQSFYRLSRAAADLQPAASAALHSNGATRRGSISLPH